ncbi:nucleoid-associated protein YgaU [Devosia subaequoris]|uniref:Nucleoid-associated protein YgaU n=1 Tax=Devosia subaequoris TaxID=395930 RepID=A0A7W6IKM9_9HYPH|nr:LysM peptidoglycan-binding domain-containing protein [Devosia subaequoris]MBB4050992.1 nucleoid-associated protein YgaU [Devosia subaequoris]MCP1208340.1 LysM peptidoglycan-binding domain-containing protein [Devosia subaequoris]
MVEVGLIPAPPAPAVAETEAPAEEVVASVEEAVPAEPELDVTPPIEAEAEADVDQVVAATFGLLRAEPDGSVVIAGSGTPGSRVEVFANGELLGTVEVESSGDWVFVPDAPLPPGGMEITLGEEGKPGSAEDSFIVVINEDKSSQPLVVASTPGEASEVLQGLNAPTQMALAPAANPLQPAQDRPAANPVAPAQPAASEDAPAVPLTAVEPQQALEALEPSEAAASQQTTAPLAPDVPAAEPETAAEPASPEPASPPADESRIAPAQTATGAQTGVDTSGPTEAAEMDVAGQPETQAPAPAEPAQPLDQDEAVVSPAPVTNAQPADEAQPPTDTPVPAAETIPAEEAEEAAAPTLPQPESTPASATEPEPAATAGIVEDPQIAATDPDPAAEAVAEQAAETLAAAPVVPPTIDAIEIENDRTFFAGAGPEGGIVRLYVDDSFVADATIEGGRWLVEAGPVLDAPSQRVRVDLLQPNSAEVIARAEVNFVVEVPGAETSVDIAQAPALESEPASPPETAAPAAAVPAADAPVEPVVVTPDQPAIEPDVAAAEEEAPPPVETPEPVVAESEPAREAPDEQAASVEQTEPVTAEPASAPPAADAPTTAEPQQALAEPVETPAETVSDEPAVPTMVAVSLGDPDAQRFASGKAIIRRGDNLWTIARRVYGEGLKYTTIYQANTGQIRDPDRIYPGQVFDLPEDALVR